MNLANLKKALGPHPGAIIRFVLPDGTDVPAHAHVTEVARVDKRFVDCGGTPRNDSLCRLQTWVADDVHHRLTAGKLLKILQKAESLLQSDELEVDVEHEMEFITQFPLASIEARPDEITLRLTTRHTACLAPEKCLPAASQQPLYFNPRTANFRAASASAGGNDARRIAAPAQPREPKT